jgi:hypothetical protein
VTNKTTLKLLRDGGLIARKDDLCRNRNTNAAAGGEDTRGEPDRQKPAAKKKAKKKTGERRGFMTGH